MKVAILSDIHGNIHALKAVLTDIRKRECNAILCLGDYVGYYYWPNEVLSTLRSYENIFFIKGNHEEIFFKSCEDSAYRVEIAKKYGNGIEYAIKTLSKENLSFLNQLKDHLVVELGGVKFGLYHGSPFGIDDYVYPDEIVVKLEAIVSNDVDVILMGHTHYQFFTTIDKKIIINPGSVGQARDVRGLASYAIFNTENMVITPYRLDYDKEDVLKTIRDIEDGFLIKQKVILG